MSWLSDINPIKWYYDAEAKWFGKDSVDDATSGINGTNAADKAEQAVEDANAQNIALQNSANSTMIELANTAHQREVLDLRKAGINPILSAQTGGATTPNLKAATVESLAPTILSSRRMVQDAALGAAGVAMSGVSAASQIGLNSALAQKASAEAESIQLQNKVKAESSNLGEFQSKYRNARPNWLKGILTDIGDTVDTINPLKVFGH